MVMMVWYKYGLVNKSGLVCSLFRIQCTILIICNGFLAFHPGVRLYKMGVGLDTGAVKVKHSIGGWSVPAYSGCIQD